MALTELELHIRDRFFELAFSTDEAACAAYRAEVDAIDVEPTTRICGLSISPFPTRRCKQLRYFDANALDEAVRPLFARPCHELPELAAGFVDPEQLCFRTFENIIGLDRMFAGLSDRAPRWSSSRSLAPGIYSFSLGEARELRKRLAQLDELGLHVAPRNPDARGGTRFIFHSADLSAALTRVMKGVLPEPMAAGFVHVNPVFRCNRFEPGDAWFLAHVDSPYYDPCRKHVSKYTLLLYLTGGRGQPALRFGSELALDRIEAMTGIVFAQELEHEGGPYLRGAKLFLRTELIYEAPELADEPEIAKTFAKACYLDGHSVFAPELAEAAAAAYDRAAAAHWRGPTGVIEPEPFVHKQFRGVHFVTNGYDAWFHKSSVSLVEAAALTILDVLNAQLEGVAFRKLCEQQVRLHDPREREWIAELLARHEGPAEPVFGRLDRELLIPEPEHHDPSMDFPTSPDFTSEPFPDPWDARRSDHVLEAFARARRWALDRIFAAPVVILGQQVFLNRDRFVIEGDKIHVLSRDAIAPVHFAGAVFFTGTDFLGVETQLDAPQLLVPPISFRETADTIRLMFDLFRNGWMVRSDPAFVPIPRVIDGPSIEPDGSPWLSAAAGRGSVRDLLDELRGGG